MAKGSKQVKPWAYSEGDLRARIKRFSETPEGSNVFGGSTDLSSLTTKISSSYASHNNLAGDLAIEGSLNISGNLTVDGTTTTVNSTVTTIDDPIMTLGGDTAPGSDDNKDRGIEFRWHDGSSAKVGFFGFDDSTGNFTFIPDATNSSEVFSGNKGTVDVGSLVSVGNISGSGKGYFEKDVEIADDLKVSGSATLGSGASNTFVINSAGRVSGSTKAIFEGDIVTADNLAATGSVSAASAIITGNASAGSATITGKLSSSYAGTNNFEGSLLVETDLLVSGTFTAGTEFVIGSDADGTDRKITFGHSTLKSVIGIDDSGDVFAINTDNAFEAANDLQIDASGHVTLGNGNLIIGADSDGTDRTITFGHSTLKTTVGIDDSSDVFAINTDDAFETANDLQIDTNGNVTLGNGAISVAGNISGSGKGYFEKDVEIADNLKVTGSITAGAATLSAKLSSSYAGSNNFEGDLIVEGNLRVSGTTTFGDAAVDLSSFSGKFSSSYAGTNNFEGSLLVETDLLVSGSATFGNASSDVTTITGRLSASEGMFIPDDKKLFFGTNNDAHIVYEEGNQDFLVISGSSAGMVLSGTTVQIRGTLQGASPLKIAGGIQIVEATNGETTNMKFGDNIKTTFGDDADTGIQYRDGALNFLEVSGSSKGMVLSGSKVSVDGCLGVGVLLEGNAITHGITLPNTDDVYGKIKANAYTTYSSLRYKDNVEPIQNAMAKIRNLSGVTYNWKTTNSSDIGFIAEEVGKVMPEIVEWESDGVNAQSMDYTKIIPVLVEAIKEQQTEIDSQKKIINELSEKIDKTKIDKK